MLSLQFSGGSMIAPSHPRPDGYVAHRGWCCRLRPARAHIARGAASGVQAVADRAESSRTPRGRRPHVVRGRRVGLPTRAVAWLSRAAPAMVWLLIFASGMLGEEEEEDLAMTSREIVWLWYLVVGQLLAREDARLAAEFALEDALPAAEGD